MILNKPSYITAIQELVGGRIGGLNNGPIEKIKFFDGQTPPTEEAIQAKLKELQADYNAKQYQRDRASAYPSWQDQMDLLYHGGVDAIKAELKKTKDKYPKPT